jgi:hypothetical protein
METNIKRSLGAYEKLFWILGENRTIEFALAAEIKGTAPFKTWEDALEKIQERYPLFNVSIEETSPGEASFIWKGKSKIPLNILQTDSLSHWEETLAQEISLPIDPISSPLIRASVVQGEGRTILILVIHHAIADGLSMVEVIRDLLNVVNGSSTDNSPLAFPASLDHLLGLANDNTVMADHGMPEPHNGIMNRAKSATPVMYKLKLQADFVHKVKDRAKKEGTTVHGALSAALVIAYRQLGLKPDTSPVSIYSLASLRELLAPGVSDGMYLNSRVVNFEPENSSFFWDLARYAKAGLQGVKELEDARKSTKGLRELLYGQENVMQIKLALASKLNWSSDIILTNLGQLQQDTDTAGLKLMNIWGPSLIRHSNDSFTIGVSGLGAEISMLQTSFLSSNLLRAAELVLIENLV